MPVRILLSYSRSDDEAFVRRLYEGLKTCGFEVWFDRISMPSRQLTFSAEIENAIIFHDRLVLVVGPGAVTSDYVTHEWRFAFHKAVRCVNPVVRLNGTDAAGKPIDGYQLIPEDLRGPHAEDFRDNAQFDQHLGNLVRQLSDPLPPVGKLVAVPDLPPHYLEQGDRIRSLRDMLLADLQKPVVVSGAAGRVGLHGMGGIGKSVLASALAHRPEVRRAFPDGVFWVTLGQEPNVAELQRRLARQLGGNGLFQDTDAGKEELRSLLSMQAALLVLDDVWQRAPADAFNVIGARGRLLLTTRDAGLATTLAANENHYQVHLPALAEAEALLAKSAGVPVEGLPAKARAVVEECGRLPLALGVCGGMVQGGTSWSDVIAAIRVHDLEYLSDNHPSEEQHRSVWRAIDASVRALSENQRERFAELAVFGLDMGAPSAAAETLWQHSAGMDARGTRELIKNFALRSLLEVSNEPRRVTMHDLVHNFAAGMAAKRFGSFAALHRRLLDAYRAECPTGWPSGPDDGYFFQQLCSHLLAAGQANDAIELLTGLDWIAAKSRQGLLFGLQDDYRQIIAALPEAQEDLRDEEHRRNRAAEWTEEIIAYARAWSERRDRIEHGSVGRRPEPPQLEIIPSIEPWPEERIDAECRRIADSATRLDRLRAFESFVASDHQRLLTFGGRPGFAVQHAHNSAPVDPVHDAACRMVRSMTAPMLLRVWPPGAASNPKPALRRILTAPEDALDVGITADGRRAVSSHKPKTLRLWDLETGRCLLTLDECGEDISLTPDGRRIVSIDFFGRIRVWALDRNCCLRTFGGESIGRGSVSVTPDGRRAVCGDPKGTLRVWDLENGQCLSVLEGHGARIWNVSATADGRRAISASDDKSLRVWNLDTGQCSGVLEGHSAGVRSVSVTPDGRSAVSGSDDNTLRIWELKSGQCLRILRGHTSTVSSVCATSDGRWAVSGSHDATLRVWNMQTGQCVRILTGHTGAVQAVSVTPDGRCAASVANDDAIRLWNLVSGRSRNTTEGNGGPVTCIRATADARAAVSSNIDANLRVWNLDNGFCLRTLEGHYDWVTSMSLTPDGRWAVSGSRDNTLRVWDLLNGRCVRVLEGHGARVESVSVTPDGRLAVSVDEGRTLRVWNLANGRCLHILEHDRDSEYSAGSVAVTPDGRSVVSALFRTIRMWDLATGKCLCELRSDSRVERVSLTPDGRRAVSACGDGLLRIWDLDRGTFVRALKGHGSWVLDVEVTADGRRAVSASQDHTVRVWDLTSGECLHTMEGHSDWVSKVHVTPDEFAFSAGLREPILRVWDLNRGTCAGLADVGTSVRALTVASASKVVLVGRDTGSIAVFKMHGLGDSAAGCTAWRSPATQGRLVASCPWCGLSATVAEQSNQAISRHTSGLSLGQAPCFDLPATAFRDTALLFPCHGCGRPIRLNPFFVDREDSASAGERRRYSLADRLARWISRRR